MCRDSELGPLVSIGLLGGSGGLANTGNSTAAFIVVFIVISLGTAMIFGQVLAKIVKRIYAR